MRLYSLGRCEIEIGETRLTPDAERLFALALYLLVARGRSVTRSEVAALLWPHSPDKLAAHNLRQTIYRLRRLGADIRTTRRTLQVASESGWADFVYLDETRSVPLNAPSFFLPGYEPRFAEPLRYWVEQQRSIVHAAVRKHLLGGLARARNSADWSAVDDLARRCLEIDPLNEEATLALAEAAVMHGSKIRGIQILDRYLHEIGPAAREIRVPATVLRRRISESSLASGDIAKGMPFVGRAEYLQRLAAALAVASAGCGSVQYVWGEPGIGKTRLVRKFAEQLQLQQVQVLIAGAQATEQSRPLSCFLDLLPSMLSLPGSLACDPDTLRTLQSLLSHEPPPRSTQTGDADHIALQNRRAILELLDCLSEEQCVVLIIDDIQWLDRLSLQLIHDLAYWVSTRRLLLLAVARTRDLLNGWDTASALGPSVLEIQPLSEGESRALLNKVRLSMALDISGDQELAYVSASGGNPFHLTELLIRHINDPREVNLESSVSALIQRRFDRLRRPSLRVLQACAILGKQATLRRLRNVLELRSSELLDALEELERSALIETERGALRCKHDFVSAAAIGRLGSASKRLLHLTVARTLEAELCQGGASSLLWDSAEHWLNAGEDERAIGALRSCAAHAISMGSPREAARILARALELPQDVGSRHAVLAEHCLALEKAGHWKELIGELEELRRLAPVLSHGSPHDEQELSLFEAQRRCGANPSELLTHLASCLNSPTSAAHRVRAATSILKICDNICDSANAQSAYDAVADVLRDASVDPHRRLECDVIYHCSFGNLEQSVPAAREWISLMQDRPSDSEKLRVLLYGAIALYYAGYSDEGRARALEALRTAVQQGMYSAAGSAAHELSNFAFGAGDYDGAKSWADEAISCGRKAPLAFGLPAALLMSACIALARGELDDAERWMAEIKREPVVQTYVRARSWVTGYGLLIAWRKRGIVPNSEELAELLRLFQLTRTHVGMDYVAVMVYDLLYVAGRPSEAAETLRAYVASHRREHTPLHPELHLRVERENFKG